MDPPRTLRRQCLGWLSSKDTLVALQSFLDDSIFSSDGYSGVFWRRMSFGTRSAGTCPGPDFCFIDASGGYDEPEISHRRNCQFVSDAVTARPDEPGPRFSKTLISPQFLAPYNSSRLYRKSGRRSLPRASHRIEGSVYWLPARWWRPVARQPHGRKWVPPLQTPRRSRLEKPIFSFESRSLRFAPAALDLSYMTAPRAVKWMLLMGCIYTMDEYRAEHPDGWLQPILHPLLEWSEMIAPSTPGAWAWREAVRGFAGDKVPVFDSRGRRAATGPCLHRLLEYPTARLPRRAGRKRWLTGLRCTPMLGGRSAAAEGDQLAHSEIRRNRHLSI